MGKFKVGDKVRLTEQYGRWDVGTEGVVTEIAIDDVDDDLIYTDTVSGVYARRLELVPTWQPKVGDRVVWREEFKSSLYTKGKTYEIKAFEHPNLILTDDADSPRHTWTAETILDNFDLAPATLTIEAGKFYKTRDGRKVGPMDLHWDGIFDGDGATITLPDGSKSNNPQRYNDDGSVYEMRSGEENDALIAEWVDEPVVATIANDNAAPAKFKVGDRVRVTTRRFGDRQFGKTGVVIDDKYDSKTLTIEIKYDTPMYHGLSINQYGEGDLEFIVPWAMPAPTPTAIVALIEDGQPKPNTRPVAHVSQEAATTEASRLALLHPGQEFGVFVLAGSKIADVVEEVVKKTVLRAA
ncbi:hypothetical protein ACU8NH_09055 [Rhizobium leguminosarum]